jgi:oligopeptidase A
MSAENPFLTKSQLPLFEQIDISKYGYETVRKQIDAQKEAFSTFETGLKNGDISFTFTNIFDKLDVIHEPLSKTFGIISHLSSVCDSEQLRDIKNQFRNELVDLGKSVGQSRVLYESIKQISTSDENENRALDLTIKGMERGGVNLPENIKDTLTNIDKKISELTTKLSENLLDVTKEYKYPIDDISIMKDTPLWARELWNSEDPENGPWIIRLGGPSITAALQHIPDSAIRKELYMKYISRGEVNEEIIISLLDLKLEKSNILGFKSFTELSLASKMATDENEILKLLDDLQTIALPQAKNEYSEIQKYALLKGDMDHLDSWDTAYWCERMREEKFNLKEEELKPYFSLDNVLNELFAISNRLFGIYIKERVVKVEVWDKSVRFFDIYDGNDDKAPIIAGFYLDPFTREDNKRGGAWMDSCIDKNKALGYNIPIAYLVCNGSPPSKNKPSLLSFSDVETLFHEFGHGLQHMLTRIDIGDISGINCIEWDAVELPSQFMENWCYDKNTLDRMAIHYLNGNKLPEEMYNNIMLQKNYCAAMGMMRQISFSKLDLYIYTHWKSMKETDMSIWDIQEKIFKDCCPYKTYLQEDKFLCTFQHIFSGYSAGYYSYNWAEIMSADCFAAFEEEPDKHSSIGKKFRDTVLSNGGSKPAMETFVEFRGRKPTVDALLRHNQLI